MGALWCNQCSVQTRYSDKDSGRVNPPRRCQNSEVFLSDREAKAQEEEYQIPKGAFLAGLSGIAYVASKRAEKEPEINQKIASLVGRLAEFETSDLKDVFRDVGSVNFFLSQPATKAPGTCSSILKKIGSDLWLDLIQSTLRDGKVKKEQAFWLLWNIYRYDEPLAKQLAQKSVNLFAENVRDGKLSEVSLPLVGLLNHLEVSTEGIFHEIDLVRASEILDSFKNKEPLEGTSILLSLIAISSKAPKDKFETLKGRVLKDPKVKSCLYNNRNTQLQSVFNTLIRRYSF